MYKLNDRDEKYVNGITIADVIKEKKFTYKKLIVKVNGKFVDPINYDNYIIRDGDDVKIHHLLAGG